MNPLDPAEPVLASEEDEDAQPGAPTRPGRAWIAELWCFIVETSGLGREVPEPEWFDRPALSKLPITTPEIAERLGLTPFSFAMVAQVKPGGHPIGTNPERCRLIAAFDSDAAKWGAMRFTNVYDGKTCRIRTGDPGECLEAGIAWVYSYRDVAEAFLRRPQAQLQTPDGRRCPPSYRGLLVRRAVTPADERPIGKQGNHIADVEAGLLGVEDVLNEYHQRDPVAAFFDARVRPALKTFTVAAVIEDCAVSARTVERVRAGGDPTPRHRTLLFDWCYEQVGRELKCAARMRASTRAGASTITCGSSPSVARASGKSARTS
jgi:hypothetical protein